MAGALTAPIATTSNISSGLLYEVTFEFESAVGQMIVTQNPSNQIATKKFPPVLTAASLDANTNYQKNNTSTLELSFVNADSATISAVIIDDVAVPVTSASLTTVTVEQNVGDIPSSIYNGEEYVITGFIYNNGFEDIEFLLAPANILTLDYTVLREVPTATIMPTSIRDDGLTFNVIVTDPDVTLTSTELNANLYSNGTTAPVIETTFVALAGGQGYQITNLTAATLYDLYIYGSYNILDNQVHSNVAISPLTPILTIPNQDIEVMTMTTTASHNTISIDDATFAGAGTGNVVSGYVEANVKVANLQQ